jgi:hypothetical protein
MKLRNEMASINTVLEHKLRFRPRKSDQSAVYFRDMKCSILLHRGDSLCLTIYAPYSRGMAMKAAHDVAFDNMNWKGRQEKARKVHTSSAET